MKKSLIALAITASLSVLPGCGSGGGDAPAASTESYSGTVNKGIVSNGKVEVCDVFDSAGCDAGSSSFYYETVTSDGGSYDVTGAPTDTPLLVLVSEADTGSTTMMCDLATCNEGESNEVSFGTSFIVDAGWTLQAIIPAATSGTTTVNVTALTDLAADEAIETAGNGRVTKAIASNANQAVQEAFGLTYDITEIGALDLTDAEAVAADKANVEEVQAALYSAVLMDFSDEDKAEILELNNDGGYTVDSSDSSALVAAYDKAETLVTTVESEANKDLDEESQISLSNVSDDIAAESEDIVSTTTVTESEDSDEIAEAKSFIQDVRTAYEAVQEEGDLRTGLDDFADQFDDIDDLVSDDVDGISKKLTLSVEAVTEVFAEVYNEEKDTLDGVYTADNGYTVTIEDSIFSVEQEGDADNPSTVVTLSEGTLSVTNDDQTVDILATTVSFNISEIETESEPCWEGSDSCTETWDSSGELNLALDSVEISEGKTTLTASGSVIADGFVAGGAWTGTDVDSGWSDSEDSDITLNSISMDLNAALAYATDDSSASFNGAIEFGLEGVEFSESYTAEGSYTGTEDESTDSESEQDEVSFTADEANLVFNGDLTNPVGEKLGIYVSLRADNSLGYTQENSWSDIWSCTWSSGSSFCTESGSENDNSSEETEEVYVKAYAIARVTTELTDANNDAMSASIELNANRTAYDVIDTSINIDYNEVEIILEADVYPYSETVSDLTVRNTTGVVATVNAFADDADIEGTITVDNVEVAGIEEADNSLVLIRYTDGTFESLF